MQLDGEYLLNPIQFSLIRNRVIPLDVCWTFIGEFGAGASCRMTVRSKMIMATTDEQEIKVDILVLWVMLLLCMYNSGGLVKGLSVVLHVINSLHLTETRPRQQTLLPSGAILHGTGEKQFQAIKALHSPLSPWLRLSSAQIGSGQPSPIELTKGCFFLLWLGYFPNY